MKNLWPDNLELNEHKITPKEFLAQQVNFLSQSTKGKLIGSLSSKSEYSFQDKNTKDDFDYECELFIHTARVQSPSLGYSFTLLKLVHSTIKLFPFSIYSALNEKNYKGNSIEDIERILIDIFRSKEVVEAITSLSSQSDEPLPF